MAKPTIDCPRCHGRVHQMRYASLEEALAAHEHLTHGPGTPIKRPSPPGKVAAEPQARDAVKVLRRRPRAG